MPERTEQHEIAEIAVTAIQSVIAAAGFAVERVTNDYGEDLLVQTSHAGQMDASRMWVQAKGTRSIDSHTRSDGRLAISVQRDHLTRWARSADPVVIVLWDCSANIGYFTRLDDRPRSAEAHATATIFLEREHTFDVDTVVELAWMSRIEHYQRLILVAHDLLEEEHYFGVFQETDRGRTKKLLTSYALDLLLMFGVMSLEPPDRWSISKSGSRTFAHEYVNADSDEDKLFAASVATVLRHASDLGVGLPVPIISEMSKVLYMITKHRFDRSYPAQADTPST
jgi:Domain of unknown function (DUF4365)